MGKELYQFNKVIRDKKKNVNEIKAEDALGIHEDNCCS